MDVAIYGHPAQECLCQGEILSNLVRFCLQVERIDDAEPSFFKVEYPFAIVLTQACDLAQDYSLRQKGQSQLPDILFCHLPTAQALRSECGGSDIWKRIKQNKDERYHFLEKIPPDCDNDGQGIPELGADFKRYFTLPTEELYRRIELGETRRRSILSRPYMEHLSCRFANFLSRIPLPRDHISE